MERIISKSNLKNKIVLKLFAIGVALMLVGLIFLLSPRQIIYCTEVGQIIIAMLAVLIALSLANLYLNIKALKERKKQNRR